MERIKTQRFQTREQLLETLIHLVQIPSITESEGEIAIAHEIERMLRDLPYFETYPDDLTLYEVANYRKVVAAFVRAQKPTRRTVVVIAHMDVVAVDEFGVYAPYAFNPRVWTDMIAHGEVQVTDAVKQDFFTGDWLFGRGTMDMKAGLVLNLKLLEDACNGEFDGNLVFLAVPDEERHSDGMIGAADLLLEWKQQRNLDYQLCIDTEPAFIEHEEDGSVIYSGTIGKLLVGAYCIGRETHVGNPFEGLSGSRMTAELTRFFELSPQTIEYVDGERTPPMVCLQSRDLKPHYSVQTPYKAGAYYNVFLMQQSPAEVLAKIQKLALEAMAELAGWVERRSMEAGLELPNIARQTKVMLLSELIAYAEETVPELVERAREAVSVGHGTDLREATTAFVDTLASALPELQPLVVLYLAPPFYPAVSSADNPLVQRVMASVCKYAADEFSIALRSRKYFPGLCDLSYVGLGSSRDSIEQLVENMPLLGRGYDLPVSTLEQLEIPVMNIGPFGRDPHKWTERLELGYSFEVAPKLLQRAIHEVFAASANSQGGSR